VAFKVINGVGNVDNAPWDKEKVWREVGATAAQSMSAPPSTRYDEG
jgi:hypothetical protein